MRFSRKGFINCDRALGWLGRLEEQRKREERKRHARKLAAPPTPVCQWCDQDVGCEREQWVAAAEVDDQGEGDRDGDAGPPLCGRALTR